MAEVRDLDWHQFHDAWTARTPIPGVVYGAMRWYELSGDWSVRRNGKEIGRAKDEAAAKAAAQSDFERIVRSCLLFGGVTTA